MKNYNDFKFNRSNLFYDIVLESMVIYKEKFKELLREMGGPMAKQILGLEGKDVETRNNFFGLAAKNDAITFVQDRKYQEIMKSEVYILVDPSRFTTRKFEKYPDAKDVWDNFNLEIPPIDQEIKFPANIRGTISQKNMKSVRTKKTYVAFYPLDKKYPAVPVNFRYLRKETTDEELSKNIQEIKAGRGMKALLGSAGINKTDKEIEEFVNKFKSTYDILADAFRMFEIVEGEDIRKYYNQKEYESQSDGQLGNSCMKSASCSEYFDIYCLNPSKCKLVILKSKKGKVKGRALLWKLDDGLMYMDRVYTNNDADINLFYEFAKFNNWKTQQNRPNVMSITLNPIEYKKFPYMDSLTVYYNKIHVLSNSSNTFPSSDCYSIQSTGGHYSVIRSCKICNGTGIKPCKKCKGLGTTDLCKSCKGKGIDLCKKCKTRCTLLKSKGKLKIGMVVTTNVIVNLLTGIICYVDDHVFYVAQNTSGGLPPAGTDTFGYRYAYGVSFQDNNHWIEFSNNPNCPDCDEGKISCETCGGKGYMTCDVCNGTKGTPCPKCSKN